MHRQVAWRTRSESAPIGEPRARWLLLTWTKQWAVGSTPPVYESASLGFTLGPKLWPYCGPVLELVLLVVVVFEAVREHDALHELLLNLLTCRDGA